MPVVWALGDATNGSHSHHGPSPPPPPSAYNQRLLEPASVAAARLNATLPTAAPQAFARIWARAKRARGAGGQPAAVVVKAGIKPVYIKLA